MPSMRLTKQKLLFKQFLENNKDRDMTVSEMSELLEDSGIKLGIATIYRAVNRLEAEGTLIRIVNGSTSKAAYRYNGADSMVCTIHRVFCTSCGKTAELSFKFTEKLDMSVSDTTGFSISDHQMMFYGHCPDCRKN